LYGKPGKGTVMRNFLLQVAFMNHPSQVPENNIRVSLLFSKIHGDICKSMCTTSINNTGSKFATGINDTSSKFATGGQDTWQIMGTLSECLNLKVNLKTKKLPLCLLPKDVQPKY
jgi:hypothetical protein